MKSLVTTLFLDVPLREVNTKELQTWSMVFPNELLTWGESLPFLHGHHSKAWQRIPLLSENPCKSPKIQNMIRGDGKGCVGTSNTFKIRAKPKLVFKLLDDLGWFGTGTAERSYAKIFLAPSLFYMVEDTIVVLLWRPWKEKLFWLHAKGALGVQFFSNWVSMTRVSSKLVASASKKGSEKW